MSPKGKKGKGKRNGKIKNSPGEKEASSTASTDTGQRTEDPQGPHPHPQCQNLDLSATHASRNGCGRDENGSNEAASVVVPPNEDISANREIEPSGSNSKGSECNPWKSTGKSRVQKQSAQSNLPAAGSLSMETGAEGYQTDFPSLASQMEPKKFEGIKGRKKSQINDDFPALSDAPKNGTKGRRQNDSIILPVEKEKQSTEAVFGDTTGKKETQFRVDFSEVASPTNCGSGSYPTPPSSPPTEAITSNRNQQPKKLPEINSSDPVQAFPKFSFPSSVPGSAGRPINLITNYYGLKCRLRYIYHYDVAISEVKMDKSKTSAMKSPSKATFDNRSRLEKQQQANVSKRFCHEAFAKFIKSFKEDKKMEKFEPIYDGGKNLFTAEKLPIHDKFSCNIPLEVDGKKKLYAICLKPVKKLDGSNVINMNLLQDWKSYDLETMNEVLLVLNAIMNHRGTNNPEIRVGRSFFSLSGGNRMDVGDGLEIWRGYHQSVHLTEKGPAVVLNLSARVFHKAGEAMNYITELLGRDITNRSRPLNSFELKKIEKALVTVRVKVTHLKYPRQYRINSVTNLSAEDLKIPIDGQEKSIAHYFREKYGGLRYPHLHCFQMNSKNNKTFVPFEKCVILPDQPKSGGCDELSKNVSNQMIAATAVLPSKRFEEIDGYAKRVKTVSAPQMQEFQLMMDLSPKKVKGRVLEAPALRYFSGQLSSPKNGSWSIAGQRFIKAQRFESWILLSFTEFQPNLKKIASDLANKFHDLGLFFKEFKGIFTFGKNMSTETILRDPRVRDASLVVIVLSKKDNVHNYDEIKFIADYGLGLVTQCVLDNVLFKNDPRIFTNICLKINTKLGGRNHELAVQPKVLAEPVIILGADVVHSTMCPSIAAVVGSMDPQVSTYKVCCRVQENEKRGKKSQELILEFENMVETILKGFLSYTKGQISPSKIICYRDGVSEGQFVAVRDHEVTSIRNASKTVLNKYIPITFMIVQKRHQTRLRPENPKDGIGRGLNIPPGTTVDTDITYPNTFDFFLCSHEGIRGTSKPSRYTILHDENNFSSDDLQKFTYDLCHLYGRCTKSVSIPAPVKYADLAAYRAKKYADFQLRKMKRNKPPSYSGRSSDLPQYARDAINNMEVSKNHMFFI